MHTRSLFAILLAFTVMPLGVYAEGVTHVIEKGETLYSIARSYDVPVSAVREANDIENPRDISAGVKLVIPSLYEVKKGDTYYSIARRYEIPVDELLARNERSRSTVLKVGETLYVPSEAKGSNGTESKNGLPRVAKTVSAREEGGLWPHPGRRARMDGKLPGVTIRGQVGDEVVSVSSGRVIYAGPYTTFGRVVIVQSSSDYIYVYGGNRALSVSVGELVRPGTPLGELGEAPDGEASRLYFSVWKNDNFVDPRRAPRS